MTIARLVQAEILDHLDEDDPRAMRSRADLRRIHAVMGTRRILLNVLRKLNFKPRRILEIGAGDASLMLRLAHSMAGDWGPVQLTLLDRQKLVTEQTLQAFHRLGWQVDCINIDILDWIGAPSGQTYDLVLANLFLHHFEEAELATLLAALSQRAHRLCACEPRRSLLALAGSRLVGLLGANAVTREDAVLSVQAGFADDELSRLMQPAFREWEISEYPAGLFSHCVVAARKVAAQTG